MGGGERGGGEKEAGEMTVSLMGGLYEYDADKAQIELKPTAQILRFLKEEKGEHIFCYQDNEISLTFSVLKNELHSQAYSYLLDFNTIELEKKSLTYGVWRRLSYFFLDAFPIFALVNDKNQQRYSLIKIIGGWINGIWDSEFFLKSKAINHYKADVFITSPIPYNSETIHLYSLDSIPIKWHCNIPEHIQNFCVIDPQKTFCINDIYGQTKSVPIFYAENEESIIFLNKIDAFMYMRDAYMETRYYGYANKNYAFYMRFHPMYGIDTFGAWLSLNQNVYKKDFLNENDASLHIMNLYHAPRYIKEEVFFALCDISGVMKKVNMPVIRPYKLSPYLEKQLEGHYRYSKNMGPIFGCGLYQLEGLPYSFGAGDNRLYINFG
jgi:hypothetical protein